MTLVLRKLPTPKRQPNGNYSIRWRHEGRYPRRNFATREEANAYITREMVEESKRDAHKARQTFAAYADRYAEEIRHDVKSGTAARYATALLHARSYFKGKAVGEILPSDCRTFWAALKAGGCLTESQPIMDSHTGQPKVHKDGTPYKPRAARRITRNSTARSAYQAFRAVLDLATDDGIFDANPAVLSRRSKKRNPEPKFSPVFLTAEQVEALAAQLPAPYDLMVRFDAYTGLRASELSGLKVADIHLRKGKSGEWRGYVDVHRQRRKRGGVWVEDTPKSAKSTRHVKLPGWLASDLSEYLANSHYDGHYDGENPDAPLFPGRKRGGYTHGRRGTEHAGPGALNWREPVEMTSFYKNWFNRSLAAAGLPAATRWHDLRHTMAALWLTAGGDIYELSEQLGHESYQTTLNFYAHLIPKDDDAPHVFDERPAAAPKTGGNVVPFKPRRSA